MPEGKPTIGEYWLLNGSLVLVVDVEPNAVTTVTDRGTPAYAIPLAEFLSNHTYEPVLGSYWRKEGNEIFHTRSCILRVVSTIRDSWKGRALLRVLPSATSMTIEEDVRIDALYREWQRIKDPEVDSIWEDPSLGNVVKIVERGGSSDLMWFRPQDANGTSEIVPEFQFLETYVGRFDATQARRMAELEACPGHWDRLMGEDLL